MTKKNLSIYFILLFIITGCGNKQEVEKTITVSIEPLKYFVDVITDNKFKVNVIVPPGAEPELYEPLPSQIKKLSNSYIYFDLGLLDFEKNMKEGILFNNPHIHMATVSDGLSLIFEDHTHSTHSHEHSYDPHVWLSCSNMKTIVKNMSVYLKEIFPQDSLIFDNNSKLLLESIDSLDIYIKEKISRAFKPILVYHPFLSYYCKEYNLKMISVEHDGKEPSVKYIMQLYELIKIENINTIFYQVQNNINTINNLCLETGIKNVAIDPLSYEWLRNMYDITDKIYCSFPNE